MWQTKAMTETVTTREIAKAAGIGPRTKGFTMLDNDGYKYQGRRYALILAALSRSDRTPTLSSRVHMVAYALRKSMVSARMPAESENRIAAYSPYRLCSIVARIVNECPEDTVGGICDEWLSRHHSEL